MGPSSQRERINSLSTDAKWEKLNTACCRGRPKEVKEILECPDINRFINKQKGFLLYAPLHNVVLSTCSKKREIMELLLSKGANPSLQCNGTYTPLHLAANIGDVESIKVLLKFDADVTLPDEFHQTPLKIAENKNHKSAAMHLRTAEVKLALKSNYRELKRMIDTLRRGIDVTDTCFNECLEITSRLNLHLASGFIMLRKPDNIVSCIQKAIEYRSFETAAMLLLCKAASGNDDELIKLLCSPAHLYDTQSTFDRTYSVSRDVVLSGNAIQDLRIAVKNIDHAFPVSVGCRDKKYAAVKCLLFNLYLNTLKKNIDWHGLALNHVNESWIEELQGYQRLDLSYNYLKSLPSNLSLLKYLKRLDLQNNKLETLPIQIFQDLPSLKCLYAQNNRIKSLPNIEKWTNTLVDLNLKNNLLKNFPENTTGAELEILNLANNKFTQLPESVCGMKTLRELDISENKDIEGLPRQLGKLKNLSKLNLSGLQILDIPLDLLKNTRELVRHLAAKLRAAKPYYIMKLMLIGKAGIGKTTLMHRLKGEDDFNENVSTAGIDIQELTIKRGGAVLTTQTPFKFRVWDFAGQHDYYTTHQCFLSECSIYLLIWDMQEKEKGLWDLAPWLDTLVARVNNCTIILVGTKLDLVEVDNLQAFEEKMFTCADELLKSKTIYTKLNVKGKFHITSKVRYRDYLAKLDVLKMEIYNAAESMTVNGKENGVRVMGDPIPLSYIVLEAKIDEIQKSMLKENKMPYINREQFLDIVRNLKCERDTLEEDEIDEATSFLKKIGTILHYDDPHDNLRDLYFISPSWLCRLMAKIITVKQAHNFFDKGILNINHIHLIIGGQNKEFPLSFYPKYLRLLSRFQIACRIDRHRILVPSKLPKNKPKNLRENKYDQALLSRYHFFTCIPYGFWSRFMSRLLLLMHEMLSPNSKKRSYSTQFSREAEIEKCFFKQSSTFSEAISESLVETIDDENDIDERDYMTPNVNGILSPSVVFVDENKFKFNTEDDQSVGSVSKPKFSNFIDSYVSKDMSFSKSATPELTNSPLICRAKYPVPEYSSSTSNEVDSQNTSANSTAFDENNDLIPSSVEERIGNSTFYVGSTHSHSPIQHHVINRSTSLYDDDVQNELNFSDRYFEETSSLEDSSINLKSNSVDSDCDSVINKYTEHSLEDSQNSLPKTASFHSFVSSPEVTSYVKDDCTCGGTFDEENMSNGSGLFTSSVDIACLIDRNLLTCWKDGVIFDHPKLYFSIKQVPSAVEKREAIETKVSNTPLGFRVLGFIVDHIKTLVREWYSSLAGTDGRLPHVMQSIPCPVCIRMNISSPHLFQLEDVFERIYTSGTRCDYRIQCPRKHRPQVVKVEQLCPDLLFQDLPSELLINPDQLDLDEDEQNKIGEGGYGKVYRCSYRNQAAAGKLYNFSSDIVAAFEKFVDIRQEISMLSKLRGHPFIVEFFGFAIQPKLCAVLELAESGTLKDVIYNSTIEIDRIVVYRVTLQISIALEFLHSKNIIHRDVKSDNVLLFSTDINHNINVKLTDFGTTNFTCPSGMKNFVGTAGFIAPEMYDAHYKDEYTAKIDIYSLAMLIYEMITRRRPFFECEFAYMIRRCVASGDRPRFKDVLKSMHSLYSLTEIMLRMWEQESNNRPSAAEVSNLIRKPVFQLLYGKRGLEREQNPRHMCFVPSKNDVWIVCDDRKGAFLIIYNMVTAKLETLTINGSLYDLDPFNLVLISLVDETQVAVVLRGSFDVVLIFSTEKKCAIIHHRFHEEHIYSMVFTQQYVFLGFQSGNFSRIPKKCFIEKKKQKEAHSISLERMRSISTMTTLERHVVLSNDRSVFVYDMDNLNNCEHHFKIKYPDQPVREIVKCENGKMFFVSFQSSPLIFLFDTNPLKIVSKIDCTDIIRKDNPNANRSDIRVTCLCSFADVLWVGTGSGHVLIYEHHQAANTLSLLFSFQPYLLEMRNLCLTKVAEPRDNVEYLMITSGKTLNRKLFGDSCFYSIEPNFPVDGAFSDSGRNSPFQPIKMIDENTKVLLIWQACNATVLKNIINYPY